MNQNPPAIAIFLGLFGLALILGAIIYWWHSDKVKFTDTINMILTASLVLITAFYAYQTQKTVELASEANRLNFRPYLVVQGAPRSVLARLSSNEEIKKTLLANFESMEDIFSLARSTDGTDYIIYSLENIGNVPARSVRHSITIYEVNKITGVKTQLPVTESQTEDLIYPHKSIDRIVPIGKDIAYRKTDGNIFLEITIKINFRGDKKGDSNNYFAIRKLSYKVVENTTSPQQMETIFQDEGAEE